MAKQFWLKRKTPQIQVRRALDNRIVFCANCEANRTLGVSSAGNLSCSSCSSENWMYLSAPIITNFKEYNERKVQERIAVDKYIQTLKREVFFTPNGAMV
jgi:ribosomal protein L33